MFLPSCQWDNADSFNRHPWSHVVIGMWHKYPNSKCTHVVSVDVLDRSVDPKTGIIRTERVLGCKQKTPLWIVKVCYASGVSTSNSHNAPSAVWRVRRCICTGNILRRPSISKHYHNLCQLVPFPVRHMLRTNPVFSHISTSNLFYTNCGDTSEDGAMAVCG